MISLSVDNNVLFSLAGLFGLLIFSSLITIILKKSNPEKNYTELNQRINSWWVMVSIFTLAMVLSRNVSLVFFALISFLAIKEFLSIIPTRRADRRVLFWVYLTIPFQYYWVSLEWYGMFIIFIPVYMFLFLPMRMVIIGETKDFLRAAGTIHWGLMTLVFSISHVAYLLVLPANDAFKAGGAGLVLFLVFLTQFNDVSQYVWGKMLGKHKIIPKVSPNKTWQGFLGGVVTTTVCSVLLFGFLTPLSLKLAIVAGLLISIAGFIGDVTVSALKRDIGVKDSGSLLPGHGGILDRVDSLTYTAPLFFHFIYYFYY
ncbi:MAG: phosphatidate cytidylyltransferase [Gammaproteobacteria bacterium]|nr:MAG: phosphatidate cytidylyltransferase [Gammaproteobacteria bacterium]